MHANNVDIIPQITKSAGFIAPYCCLIAITDVGIIVTPAVFKTKKVTIASLATPSSSSLNNLSLSLLLNH